MLLLGPWTGTIVSRARSVPRLLIIAQLSAAAAAAAIAALQFAGLLTEDWLIAGALGLGLAYCLTLPAASVLVPALIPARESGIKPQSEIRAAMALNCALLQHRKVRRATSRSASRHLYRVRLGIRA